MNIILIFILLIIIAILIVINIKIYGNKYKHLQIDGGTKQRHKQLTTKPHNAPFKNIRHSSPTKILLNPNLKSKIGLTYTISGEGNGLEYSQLRLLLKNASILGYYFIEKPVTEKVDISFGTFGNFYIRGKLVKKASLDPKFYYQKAAIKNVLNGDKEFTTQSKLYYTVQRLLPSGLKYLPKSYDTSDFERNILNTLDGSKIYIIKKDNSNKQKGVILIKSKEEYYIAKDQLYKAEILKYATEKHIKKNYNAIISEYITNPLLLNGKKFHLRIHFLVSIVSGIAKCIVTDNFSSMILTAKENYINDNWENRDIHLTGAHSTLHRYLYPDDIIKQYSNDFKIIQKNVDACNQFICSFLVKTNISNYPESYAGYYLYGADIMITNDFNVYILEINDKPGFGKYGEDIGWNTYSIKYSNHLFSFILNNAIFPFFGINAIISQNISAMIPKNGNIASSYGKLSQFIDILSKYKLIPYLGKMIEELKNDKNWIKLINSGDHINIFLIKNFLEKNNNSIGLENNNSIGLENNNSIGLENNNSIELEKSISKTTLEFNDDRSIVGYIGLNRDNYLILKLYKSNPLKNNLITAMIAQFIEIMTARNYIHHGSKKIIKIAHTDSHIHSAAKILHFKLNNNNYEKYI